MYLQISILKLLFWKHSILRKVQLCGIHNLDIASSQDIALMQNRQILEIRKGPGQIVGEMRNLNLPQNSNFGQEHKAVEIYGLNNVDLLMNNKNYGYLSFLV